MGRFGKVLVGLVVVGAILVAVFYSMRERIALGLMASVVERNMAADPLGELSEGLHVGLCGAGAPMADAARGGPCAIVLAKQGDKTQTFVVDAGTGGVRTLQQMGLPAGAIDGVLLTHFHSDHIDGLGELAMQRWVNRTATSPLPVYGPAGVERVVNGFNEAYSHDFVHRTDHHGDDIVPASGAGMTAVAFAEPVDGVAPVIVDRDGLKITTFKVDHTPVSPAVGYRFDFMGRSIVISGDTVKSDNLIRFAKDADLLMHEALSPTLVGIITDGARKAGRDNIATITVDILDYHTYPVQAAEAAQEAGVDMLVFHHIVPPLPLAPLEDVFMEGVSDAYDGPAVIAVDGDFWSLPAGSDDIHHSERL
ncbi:MBL fold metallo-hydrolase [Pyruvatibacter sp.]|uniref:MBL fold metallo-hydrolase n=1 Tax=Pyruvatibacter sp. TaxID=1981328 RepID=UPI0032667A7B